MRRLGATPEQLAQAQAKLAAQAAADAQAEHYGVWEENWATWVFFCSLETQWDRECLTRTLHGPGGSSSTFNEVRRVRLPSERVESHLRLKGIGRALWPAMFADIQRMEIAVLKADQAKRDAEAASA